MTASGHRSVTVEEAITDALAARDNNRAAALLRRAFGTDDATGTADLPELLEEFAEYLAVSERADEALAIMVRAAELASPDADQAELLRRRCRVAEMLLKAGLLDEASAIYIGVAEEAPGQAWVHETAGSDHLDAGEEDLAFAWLTAGLEQAIANGDDGRCVARLLGLRRMSMGALGLAVDDLDRQAASRIETPHICSADADDLVLVGELEGEGVAPERALRLLECLRRPEACEDHAAWHLSR